MGVNPADQCVQAVYENRRGDAEQLLLALLLLGAGGREHALAWKLAASPLLGTLYCADVMDLIASLPEEVHATHIATMVEGGKWTKSITFLRAMAQLVVQLVINIPDTHFLFLI